MNYECIVMKSDAFVFLRTFFSSFPTTTQATHSTNADNSDKTLLRGCSWRVVACNLSLCTCDTNGSIIIIIYSMIGIEQTRQAKSSLRGKYRQSLRLLGSHSHSKSKAAEVHYWHLHLSRIESFPR